MDEAANFDVSATQRLRDRVGASGGEALQRALAPLENLLRTKAEVDAAHPGERIWHTQLLGTIIDRHMKTVARVLTQARVGTDEAASLIAAVKEEYSNKLGYTPINPLVDILDRKAAGRAATTVLGR